MNLTFRYAIMISAVVHALAISPLYGISIPKVWREKPLEVEYTVIEEPQKVELTKAEAPAKPAETPKVELQKEPVIQPVKPAPAQQVKAPEKAKQEARELAKKREAIRSTKAYVNYYKLIREKIRRRLKYNYRGQYKEGEVALAFILRADGTLASCGTEESASASDKRLASIAVESLREAGPFPPFPKEIDLPDMSFNVLVAFRRNE
ncbi:MAG: TonB family protein [Candidatus Omnitrophica bacterium]|nr:TonB family protein [Candidatus Omnitrophota bacterium]